MQEPDVGAVTDARPAPTADRTALTGEHTVGTGVQAVQTGEQAVQTGDHAVSTGDHAVDEALRALAGLDDHPVREHVAVFDSVHRALSDRLAETRD